MGAFRTDQNASLPGTIGDFPGQLRGWKFAFAIRDKLNPQEQAQAAYVANGVVSLLQFAKAIKQIIANCQGVEFQVIALNHIEHAESYGT